MTQTTCDRCGEPAGKVLLARSEYWKNGWPVASKEYDLCLNCLDEFDRFMRAVK